MISEVNSDAILGFSFLEDLLHYGVTYCYFTD